MSPIVRMKCVHTLYTQAEILVGISVKLSHCSIYVKCLIWGFVIMAIFDSFALASYEISSFITDCTNNLFCIRESQYATLSPRSQLIKYYFIFSREKLLPDLIQVSRQSSLKYIISCPF